VIKPNLVQRLKFRVILFVAKKRPLACFTVSSSVSVILFIFSQYFGSMTLQAHRMQINTDVRERTESLLVLLSK